MLCLATGQGPVCVYAVNTRHIIEYHYKQCSTYCGMLCTRTLPSRNAGLLCTQALYCVSFYRNRFVSTRYLQSICSKAGSEHENDVVLLISVPPFKYYVLLRSGNLFSYLQETVLRNKTWAGAERNSSRN